ncbi:formylmethanofuran dehydrogenase subunit E region [Oleidesulfovibrio alaskensis G20]|jgi:formylmethanofuran dehydrogenase subunit E|uniref:Formylmethanofuran dehydrogenase subunit E region n=1 Tax=Oleidesulfovibrio alaskensis (strain ATCC BAA-1058 / DSM 17464 / G20) TaxID=207559 RepID=Q311H4_OLEA2|nr:FmdE family protein [Oleidesulfovibrio alaskensis]ABB38422.1 formylmethanofuran dehydrogenase subunit E region [Oleidesulfovibrio alaskensis G20]MBG0773677.1 TraR/DksA C4-type zinc finger protein [Oleidesulfovibrio alaskensis]MBL3583241.1 TraR/DksA C4-type zinc finger protein [Oleidesulfovibrio alaskensis]
MTCGFSTELLERVEAFHGHRCPGLAIGVRAAELALNTLGSGQDVDMVSVVETDMCGVDAIQFITGCTLGKGNLIHRDYGKMAFCFYDRTSGRGIRAVLRPEARGAGAVRMAELMKMRAQAELTSEMQAELSALRDAQEKQFYTLPLEEMFSVSGWDMAPRPAAVLASLECAECGEHVMESRTRRFGGRTLCIPCFMDVEQKI